jgi:hypothetical protein
MQGSLIPGLTSGRALVQGNLFVVGKLSKTKEVPMVDDMERGDEGQAILISYIYIRIFICLSNITRGIFLRSLSIFYRWQ